MRKIPHLIYSREKVMTAHQPRLFIPGPTEVFPEVLAQYSRPVISHRGPEIGEITRDVFDKLRILFRTEHECYVALSAATGLMEGAVRNLVKKRLLSTVCGAFSARQHTVANKCGIPVDALEVPFGKHIEPAEIDKALSTGKYDVVTVVHSETSTGTLNPIAEIGAVVKKYDDVLFVVDCVSSLGGAQLEVDAWGIDLAFAGTQKCIALSPGLTVFAVSPRAMERCASIENRGHYFDFLNYRKMAKRGQCPATTGISLLYGLQFQLGRIATETMEARWQRHLDMAKLVRGHLNERFRMFPEPEFATPTETVYYGDGLGIAALISAVQERGMLFGNGYGPMKGENFRIGHMGDLQVSHLEHFLAVFDEELAKLK
ncbi:MAG: alanine--glyoxylate aminotransferase family protein [Planctomycetota bacterium]